MSVERYGHGGDVWTAAERFGVARGEIADFSANLNPLGPPPSVMTALREGLEAVIAYPDPVCRELQGILAAKDGVPSDCPVLGNGAAEVLYGVMRALQPRKVGLAHPCFSEYAEAAGVIGAELVAVTAREADDFLPAKEELLAVCREVDLFVIGYPNNPNGRLVPFGWLREMAEVLAARGGYLLVDEAFLDFVPDAPSLAAELGAWERVILLRSMTKFYSMAGLRLGYALAVPELARRIARELPPWRVNALAQLAGVTALQDEAFAERTLAWLAKERVFLREGLARLPGVRVYGGEVNYVLFFSDFPGLQAALGRQGILIRSCVAYPGLGEGYYRVAVRLREENERLLGAMGAVLSAASPSAGQEGRSQRTLLTKKEEMSCPSSS